MLALIDYGAGNTYNVKKAFNYLGKEVILTKNPNDILKSEGIILPGVGAFKTAMDNLKKAGLIKVIQEVVKEKKPLLGICLGMQMLFDYSMEYGKTMGLKLISGSVEKIPNQDNLLIPEIGWNQNHILKSDSFFKNVDKEFTYFVHSYYAKTDVKNIVSYVNYGIRIPAIVQKENVIGMQFHPEKSGFIGLELLKNFLEVVKDANKSSD